MFFKSQIGEFNQFITVNGLVFRAIRIIFVAIKAYYTMSFSSTTDILHSVYPIHSMSEYRKHISKFIILASCLIALTFNASAQTTFCTDIASAADDAEEVTATSVVSTTSLDLDFGTDELIGLRFLNVTVPANATITSAYIQFVAEETDTISVATTISGEAANNSAAFTTAAANLSSRNFTTESIPWTLGPWTAEEQGVSERTPDLRSIVTELVQRSGYVVGNPMTFFIQGPLLGKNVAYAYDLDPTKAASLCITYELPCPDADNDGVCDDVDVCAGSDDNLDADNDGIPDGCDNCADLNNNNVCDNVDPCFGDNIVINEINYRSIKNQQDIDFVEIYNHGSYAVDLTGWKLTNGLNYSFPNGTTIGAGAYLVIASDPSTAQTFFGGSGYLGPYSGKLSSSGDYVSLRDDNYKEKDKVDYKEWGTWPSVRFKDYQTAVYDSIYLRYDSVGTKVEVSIQKINPELPGQHGGSWSSETPTPNAANAAVFKGNPTNIPVIKTVNQEPPTVTSADNVLVEAELRNLDGIAGAYTVTLQYQIVDPGAYIARSDAAYLANWTDISMNDNGSGADATAGDETFSASIPASLHNHRRLIRYRVKVSNSTGFNEYYPDAHHLASNYAYYVYDGYPDFKGINIAALEDITATHLLTTQAHTDTFIMAYPYFNYPGEGTLVYNNEVYDHIRYRAKGGDSRHGRTKRNIKIAANGEQKIEVLDDNKKAYKEKRSKLVLSGTWVNDPATHGLMESLTYKILNITGAPGKHTDYTQFRIVDNAMEADSTGDFWGIYLTMEDYGGDFYKEHDLPDGNLWGFKPYSRSEGDFPFSDTMDAWSTVTVRNPTLEYPAAQTDTEIQWADRAANEIFGQGDKNYYGKHSYREFFNPETGLRFGWCSDFDDNFGMFNTEQQSYPRSYSDSALVIQYPLDFPAAHEIGYKNALRSAYDLIMNQQQSDFLVDMESRKIFNSSTVDWTEVDKSRWNQTYDLNTKQAQFAWYKQWFIDRGNVMVNDTAWGISDPDIPNTPSIALTGTSALNNLTFSNTAFTDPNGNGTFAALEWRVGEWSDPSNPIYTGENEPKYEIEAKWESGEITSFSNNYTIPADAQLKVGRTYKIRVRYKDNTGRFGHWSNAVTVVPTNASGSSTNLVINEIMYNPMSNESVEFIEIYNKSSSAQSLNNVKFVDGVDFDFYSGTTIPGNGYLVITNDSLEFINKYGFTPYAEYSGTLSNSGEHLELVGPFRRVIDSLTYSDGSPWTAQADGLGFSLGLKLPLLNNSLGSNWDFQNVFVTPNAVNTFNNGTHAASPIKINEIHYHPEDSVAGAVVIDDDFFEFIELKNTTANQVDLSGMFFSDGVEFVFPKGASIPPYGFIVLGKDADLFNARYGAYPDYVYEGKLQNGGEDIWLNNADGTLADIVSYDDASPWDDTPDKSEYSLALLLPDSLDNNAAASWSVQSTPITLWAENEFDFEIYGSVLHDTTGNANIDGNPVQAISGLYVNLVDDSGVVVEVTEVDQNGHYLFNDAVLANKTYTLNLSTTPGLIGGQAPTTSIPSGYGIVGEDCCDEVGNDGTADAELEVTTGLENVRFADFGIRRELSIGNLVWHDINLNGILNTNEPGLSNVIVNLYEDANNDGTPDGSAIKSTFTDATGLYVFEYLHPGNYIVGVLPGIDANGLNFVSSPVNEASANGNIDNRDNGISTNASNETFSGTLTVTPGLEPTNETPNNSIAPNASSNLTLDFGFYGSLEFGGHVYDDINGQANSLIDGTGIGSPCNTQIHVVASIGGTVVASMPVNPDGSYSFVLQPQKSYNFRLSNVAGVVGNTRPPITFPCDYISVGEGVGVVDAFANGTLTFNSSTISRSDLNFGIQQPPLTVSSTAPSALNPGSNGTITIPANLFGGTDPSSGGSITNLVLCGFPSGVSRIIVDGISYNSNTWPSAGITIPSNASGVPTQTIEVDPLNSYQTVSIPFSVLDDAGTQSACDGTVVMPICDDVDLANTAAEICNGDDYDLTAEEPTTASGGTWKKNGVVVSNPSSVASGTYDYSYTNSNGCTLNSTLVIDDRIPDFTTTLAIAPSAIVGASSVRSIVNISEIQNKNSCGDVYVLIPKDISRFTFTYAANSSNVGGVTVSNGDWQYFSSNPAFHVWQYVGADFSPLGVSRFGFIGTYNPNNTDGQTTFTVQIFGGSGGETNTLNNSDSESLLYFK